LVVLAHLQRRWSLSGREGFGVRRFCGDETLIFHCAEGWNQRRSHRGDRRCFSSDRCWLRRRQMQLPCLVLCPRWCALFYVRWTLVLGATDTDISVCRLTLIRALLKEAMNTVVLNRRTCLLRSGEHRPYWTMFVGATDAGAILDGRIC
jgi:hypothetical protein